MGNYTDIVNSPQDSGLGDPLDTAMGIVNTNFAESNARLHFNTGNPNGAITATVGALCIDSSNGRVYLKRTGAGTNTGWEAVPLLNGDSSQLFSVKNAVNDDNAVNKGQFDALVTIDNYITGLVPSNNSTDSEHDIDFSVGVCRDSSSSISLRSTSVFSKSIDSNWASGTGNGGFPSGITIANDTWYHLFIIGKTDGTVDFGFDTSLTATNLLADATGYTIYRRVGSVLTDGSSNIKQFRNSELSGGGIITQWYYATETNGILEVAASTTAGTDLTITAPLGIKTKPLLHCITITNTGSTATLNVIDKNTNNYISVYTRATTNTLNSVYICNINTSLLSQIRYTFSGYVAHIVSFGYTDERVA